MLNICPVHLHGSLLGSNAPVSLCVRRNASVWVMTNKKRSEWELKSCCFLVARQPQRSALEDLELSPFILKVSVTGWTLVWTHQCRMSVRRSAETDGRKPQIWSTCHNSINTCRWRSSQHFLQNLLKSPAKLHIAGWKPHHVCFSPSLPVISHLRLIIHGCLTIQHRHLKPCMSDSDSQRTIKAK